MKKDYLLNTLLAIVLGAALLVMVAIRAVFPNGILPDGQIPNLVLVSLAALLPDHYLAPGAKRRYGAILLLSAAAFGLLPYGAGFATPGEALRLAALGGVVFTAVTWLFTSLTDRIASGPASKAAPFLSAVGLYLAAQCLMGMVW